MALPKKLLSRDEVVVRHMRTHPKVLIGRTLLEALLLVAAVVGTVYAPESWNPWGYVAIWVVWLLVTIPLLLVPWMRWMSTTYTVTTKRVITRSGIFNKTGHDLPLSRISDVQQDRSAVDRLFGAGTLRLQTSADDPLTLTDVPQVETVQVEIANLLFHDVQGAIDADPDD
ncbi:PH domain-containing protein [Actinomyces radicidentis]|uniref:PH domain-containing protein n=1 Tax=Actinomyces radicidentis TaxID=111015 RepID=UPI0028E535DB|nr:PH domain-containing protein [Actinomyces radicidentis]